MGNCGRLVWITGVNGFLGQHALTLFENHGWRVIGIGRHDTFIGGQTAKRKKIGFSENILKLLIRDYGKPQLVFHAAGTGSVAQAEKDRVQSFHDTVSTTQLLCKVLCKHSPDTTVISASSAAVYGVCENSPIKETSECRPVSYYGLYKKFSEELLEHVSKYDGLRAISIRYFSLYGPNLRKQIIWDISRKIHENDGVIELFGDGGETRDFLFVEDAIRLAMTMYKNASDGYTVINGGSGKAVSICDLAQEIIRISESSVKVRFNGFKRVGDPRYFQACSSKAKDLGFEPKIELQEGIARTVEWIHRQVQKADV